MKYRDSDQKQTMHRLDPVLQELDGLSSEGKDLGKETVQREKLLSPLYTQVRLANAVVCTALCCTIIMVIYKYPSNGYTSTSSLSVCVQIAHEFADLHDRAGRMVAKVSQSVTAF